MSAVFIISTQGRVLLPYYFDHIADHPPLSLLLGGVLATRWDQPFDGPVTPPAPKRRAPARKKKPTTSSRKAAVSARSRR